jgi:hypothetical protein
VEKYVCHECGSRENTTYILILLIIDMAANIIIDVYGIAWSEIFIEPPPYAQQRRRRGERGTGVTKGS